MEESLSFKGRFEAFVPKLKEFLESKIFVILMSLFTLLTWKTGAMYPQYFFIFLIGALLAIAKANCTALFPIYFLYMAGNSNRGFSPHGPYFIVTLVLSIPCLIPILYRFYQARKYAFHKCIKNPILWSLFAMWCTMLLSIINSPIKLHTFGVSCIMILVIFMCSLVICTIDNTDKSKEMIAFSLMCAGIVVFIQLLDTYFEVYRISGFDANNLKTRSLGWAVNNHASIMINIAFMATNYMVLISSKLKSKIAYSICLLIFLCAPMLTMCRGEILGLLVLILCSFLLFFIFSQNKKQDFSIIGTLYSLILLTSLVFVLVGKKLNSISFILDRGVELSGREDLWKIARTHFKEHCIFGSGYGTSKFFIERELGNLGYHNFNYHNHFLQISTCGSVGIISFIVFIVMCFKMRLHKNAFNLFIISLIVYFVIHGSIETIFFHKLYMSYICMMLCSCTFTKNKASDAFLNDMNLKLEE